MRSFDDERGYHWQVALLDASLGNVWMVFSRIGSTEVFKHPLDWAGNLAQAEQLLAAMDAAALKRVLSAATPWSPGSAG